MRSLRLLLPALLAVALLCFLAPAQGFSSRSGDFNIAAGLWLGGDVTLGDYGVDITKSTGLLLRVSYDTYVAEKLAVGLYGNFSPVSWEESDASGTLYEIGMAIKPRFIIANGAAAIKPGLNVGYRGFSSSFSEASGVSALGVNASVEVQFMSSGSFLPFFEIGFLSQPAGGNDLSDVTFAPIIYLGGGVSF